MPTMVISPHAKFSMPAESEIRESDEDELCSSEEEIKYDLSDSEPATVKGSLRDVNSTVPSKKVP